MLGKSWLLRRLLFLQRILALVQYLLYAVWCTERTAYPYALCGGVRWCREFRRQLLKSSLTSRWWMITSCKNVIGWCRDMKEKADDLETFRERFRRLCWLDGPNRSIIMLYLWKIRLWDESWEAQYYMKFVCSVFRLRFLLHMIVFLDFYFEKRAPMLFPVWGLAWVSCVRRRELIASGVLSK